MMMRLAARVAGRLSDLGARLAVLTDWSRRAPSRGKTGASSPGPPLVISLTSFPPRYPTLALTLKSLLVQDLPPAAVLLWIAHGDLDALPVEVRALEAHGLRICPCDDYRSHKKYHSALIDHPAARIVVCDDDTYYWRSWLRELAEESDRHPTEVVAHRAHKIALDPEGIPLTYAQWQQDLDTPSASPSTYATGGGGILLPPGRLDPRVADIGLATALCPTADDIWLYYMARLAGTLVRKIGGRRRFVIWRSSQRVALWQANNVGERANDRQMAAMVSHFGAEGIFR